MNPNKLSKVVAASLLALAQMGAQAQTAAGASAATGFAFGSLTSQEVAFAAAGVAILASANSGNSGPFIANGNNAVAAAAATSATTASTQAASANSSVSSAITALQAAAVAAGISTNTAYIAAAAAANAAATAAATAATAASDAAADLAVASKVEVVGVVNGSRTVCAAANTCTKAEILALNLKAAQTAVASANATNFAIYMANALKNQIVYLAPTAVVTAATAFLTTASTAAVAAQTAANDTIAKYQATATAFGTTGTTITSSTGTTGTTGTVGVTGTTGTR